MQTKLPIDRSMLEQILDRAPLRVAPNTSILDAIVLMSQEEENSCVLVVNGARLVGIFTERDAIGLTASGIDLAGTEIARGMAQPVISLTLDEIQDPSIALSLMRQHRIRHLPVVDDLGELVGLTTLERIYEAIAPLERIEEISDRQHLEAELRRREQQFASLVENSPDIIFRLDLELRHTYISPRVTETSGLSTQDFLGKTGRELGLPAAACDVFEAACRDAIATGEVTRVEYAIADRHHVSRLIPERSASGAIESLMGITEDITERVRLEAQLQIYTVELEHLYNDAPCGYHSLDAEGRIVRINQTELTMLGYSREEIIGKKITDFYTPESLQTFQILYPTFMQRGWVKDLEFTIVRKDASLLPVSISATTVKDEAGNYLMSRSIMVDISDRQQVARNLAFLAEISQDLANWTSINATLQTIGAKIGAFLKVSRCYCSEIDEAADTALVAYDWHEEELQSLSSDRPYRLSDFLTEEFYREIRTGEIIVIRNTLADPRVNAESCAALGIHSSITSPYVRDGKQQFLLCITDSAPRDWRDDEIELLRELTARIWLRLERARDEASLAADLRDTQLLRNLSLRSIAETDIQVLYDEIVTTAIALMHSDAGSLQILDRSRNELQLQACQGFHPDAAAFWQRVGMETGSVCGVALERGERTIVPDLETCDFLAGTANLDYYRLCGIRAVQSCPSIARSGQLIGMFSTHWQESYQPSDRELRFLDLLARQAADLIEQRQAEATLRQSEALHRTLFDSIDEGICLFERLPARPDGLRDYRYLAMNPTMQVMFGIPDLSGQSIRDNFPDEVEDWYDDYDRVLETGEAIRFERESEPQGMVLEMFVTRVGDGSGQRLLAVMQNVTDRKRREANLAFLAEITEDFSRLSTADEIMRAVGAKVGTYLNISNCLLAEINEVQDRALIEDTWHTPDTPDVTGVYRLSDFITEELRQAGRSGETIIIRDTQTDPRTDRDRYAALKIHAFVTVPFHREGEWKYVFTVNDSVARDWREDEIELIREVTNRTFPRLDRARAEAALRHNHEMFSALVENAPFGIYVVDAQFRLQQINQGAEAVFSNIDPLIGRDFAEIIRIVWSEPFATEAINRFHHTFATGESYYSPVIVEQRANIDEIQAYDWQIHRITLPDGSYGVVCYFYNLTEIKQAEETIRRIAQRDAFLVALSDALRPVTDPVELQATAARILGEYLGANRVVYFEIRGSDYVVERDYVNSATPLSGRYPIASFSAKVLEAQRAGRTISVSDLAADPDLSPEQKAAYAAIQIAAHLDISLLKGGEFVAGLAIHASEPRQWTPDGIALSEAVAERTWAAVERAHAEAALRENEQLLRFAMTSARAGSWDWEILTGKVTWSPENYALYGLDPNNGSPQYADWENALHPDDRELANQDVSRVVEGRLPEYRSEFRIVHPQRGVRWLLGLGHLSVNDRGEPIRLNGINLDITDRKQAELMLQQQLQREQAIADIARDIRQSLKLNLVLSRTVERVREVLKSDRVIIFRFRPDWQGDVIMESVGAEWTPLLSTTIFDPCFRDRYIEPYRQGRMATISDIDTADLEPCYVELLKPLQVKANLVVPILQGEQLWGLLIAHQCSAPRQWQPSEIDLLRQLAIQLGIAIKQSELYEQTRRELLERKLAEQQIQEQAALLDIASDAIFVRDLDHRILYWNQGAERLYGWQAAEAMGQKVHELLQEDAARIAEIMQTLFDRGEWRGESRKVTKTGKEVIVEGRWTLVRDKAGQPKSILNVNTDITEKKQLEVQFYRAQRLESIGTLASGIAHDFNNLLTPMLAVAELLPLKIPNLDNQTRKLLSMLEDSAKRGANLVQQVLSFSRGTEGQPVILQIGHLLSEVVNLAQSTFPKSIEISTAIPTRELWTISADATQIHQVLMNLLVNARDAMPDGGNLTIAVENRYLDEHYARMNLEARVGSYVAIAVSDTGTGIRPETIERIFDPFFTTKEVGRGTGLGLATVLGIVKNHGGFVRVSSEVGKGTQFQVFLPAAEGTPSQLTSEEERFGGNGELILIVDDEETIQEIIKTSLENSNYRTLLASDGIEAIALYAECKQEISVVLIDLMMPNLDGLTAIDTLQKINPQVKVIATSGLPVNESLGLPEEVKTFLPKPYTLDELLRALHNLIAATDSQVSPIVY